jgi:hypothetical protein
VIEIDLEPGLKPGSGFTLSPTPNEVRLMEKKVMGPGYLRKLFGSKPDLV